MRTPGRETRTFWPPGGWYNGLAKAHKAKLSRIKDDEHEVIVYCKANPDKTIIQAIDTIFKSKK